jgi:hypothetical protein
MSNRRFLIIVITFLSILTSFIFAVRTLQEKGSCTYSISLKNGSKMEAKRINFYPSGFYDIHKCGGERIVIPETSIKEIKNIGER